MSTRPLGAADRDLEARLRALEMRLEAVQQSGEVVLSMLQRDLQTAAPAVVRAIDRVGLLVRRVLPQAAPGSSSLVWLANRDCGMARLPLGPVVKMASFLELWRNPLPCVATVFAFPQPNLAGRSVASCASKRRGPPERRGLRCWLDASLASSLTLFDTPEPGSQARRVVAWRDISGGRIHATTYNHQHEPSYNPSGDSRLWRIGGLPAVYFRKGNFMTASEGTRVRTIAMVFHSTHRGHQGWAMLFAEDNHADFSLRIHPGNVFRGPDGGPADFQFGHPEKLWLNGRARSIAQVVPDRPAVVVCVKRAGRRDDDDFRFQLSSRFRDRGLNGLIGEVLVYDRELSEDEALRTSRYLAGKWGIPLTAVL